MIITLDDLEFTRNLDGTVTIKEEKLLELLNDRNEKAADINLTVTKISQLLKDLGILTPQGEFEFRMGSLVKSLQDVVFRPAKAEQKFKYLADLQQIIERYSNNTVVVNKN